MFEEFDWWEYLGPYKSAWEGHIYYIYNEIPIWKPKVIVELGVYYGHSLATMAESCRDNELKTKLYGIDHFQGDEHAGKFGKEIENVATECLKQYDNVKLIKKTFNSALKGWDKPIDLLHIDGRHFYEDIKEDFENWSKFVPKGGHIIMHDTQVEDWEFGIKKYFAELKRDHPEWKFSERTESYGLGIITL